MAMLQNYLVYMRVRVRSIKRTHYFTLVAPDQMEAENAARRLSRLLPGEIEIVSVDEV